MFRPELRPAVKRGAKEEERIGAHLLVLVVEVAPDDRDAASQPRFEPARCLDDVHKIRLQAQSGFARKKKKDDRREPKNPRFGDIALIYYNWHTKLIINVISYLIIT